LQACRLIEDDAAGIFSSIGMDEIDEDPPTDLDTLREAQAEDRLWVAADGNDVPVAFVYARQVEDHLYIQELDVLRSRQRQGIGGRLIEAVCRAAAERGFGAVTLSTFAEVPWNAPYYERLGFARLPHNALTPGMREIEDEEAAFGLDVSRRVFMRREI
jgi:predicted N-acetyltransferase YhbS